MIRAVKAVTCLAIATCVSIGVCFVPSALMQQAEAKASSAAIKWLKGNWYTNKQSGKYPDEPNGKVRFTKNYVNYYVNSGGGKWTFSHRIKIAKSKKTKKGYTVFLEGDLPGARYEAMDGKRLCNRWGKDGYSGSGSLWRK